jgi:hypothetical protein
LTAIERPERRAAIRVLPSLVVSLGVAVLPLWTTRMQIGIVAGLLLAMGAGIVYFDGGPLMLWAICFGSALLVLILRLLRIRFIKPRSPRVQESL